MRLLPSRTVQSHAANLHQLADGDLACVWFGGTQEGMPDVGVWFARLGGGEPVLVSEDPARSEQNPVLFTAPDGVLWLLHTAQHAGDQDTAVVRARRSADSGRTWSATRDLLSSVDGGVFVRQPPVFLPSGRWLLPTFTCRRTPGRKWSGEADTSGVHVSDDSGATWREVPVPSSTGLVHMNIVPSRDGGFVAYFRSRWADHIYRSVSADGVDWEPAHPTSLPNNNSSIQAAVLPDGRTALAFNDSSRLTATARRASLYDEISSDGTLSDAAPPTRPVGEGGAFWGAPRAPLVLAVSADDGLTWPERTTLAEGDGYALSNNSRDGRNRELSYPSVLAADGGVYVAFTFHRKAIALIHHSL